LLKGIGLLYWVLALAGAALAVWWFKRWWLKLGATVAVLALFIVPAARHVTKQQAEYNAAKAKLDAAQAHFEMRCKSAGEKITRTVENVDGVVWMKWRDKHDVNDDYDQFKLSDPYGRDCRQKECIQQLLSLTSGLENDPQKRTPYYNRFRYVESVNPGDGQWVRFTLTLPPKDLRLISLPDAILNEESIAKPSARYGITWDDISTRDDREHWVAGGSIKVVDIQTNEVIGERIGYMMDRGQGSTAGFRTPWIMARRTACPPFNGGERSWPNTETLSFAIKVLQPSK
jgi:hypothetical protein